MFGPLNELSVTGHVFLFLRAECDASWCLHLRLSSIKLLIAWCMLLSCAISWYMYMWFIGMHACNTGYSSDYKDCLLMRLRILMDPVLSSESIDEGSCEFRHRSSSAYSFHVSVLSQSLLPRSYLGISPVLTLAPLIVIWSHFLSYKKF